MNALRTIAALSMLALAPATLLAAAAPDLAGDWQGKLAVDATNSLTVRFTFTKGANGAVTAVLNSPDNAGVKDVAVSNVSWDGTNLKLTVPTLSGAYAGALKNGKLAGEWTQPGAKLPLELAPYSKPVMTAAVSKSIAGDWNGIVKTPAGDITMVFAFKQGTNGALEGTFRIPAQGANMPMTDVMVENGELRFKTAQGRINYVGKVNGDRIAGKLKVPDPTAPPDGLELNVQRGEFKAPAVPLKGSTEAFAAVKGKWTGTITVPNPQTQQEVKLPVTVRFESNGGQNFGYLDVPPQNIKGMPINEVALADGKIKINIGSIQAEYSGTLADGKLTGEWGQGGQRLPLELTRTP